MTNNFVTEISEEDFKKLNLVGYDHKRVEYDTYNKIEFVPKFLNEVIDENKNFCKENGWSTIAIAIHTEPTEEEIQKALENVNPMLKTTVDKNKVAKEFALINNSYCDKWLNRQGSSTYVIGCGIEHLYSTRDYWEIKNDYWKVKKRETKAIYIVHLEL